MDTKRLLTLVGVAALIATGCTRASMKPDIPRAAEEDDSPSPGYPAYYCGTIPAADAEGAFYGLAIAPGADGAGCYKMRTEYVGAPVPNVFVDSGHVDIKKGIPGNKDAVVMCLVSAVPGQETTYFIDGDSILTMVGPDFKPAASGLSYTLKKQM